MISEAFVMPTATFHAVLCEALGLRHEYLSHVYAYRAYKRAEAFGAAADRVISEVRKG